MSRTSPLTQAIKENISIVDYAQQIGYTPQRIGNQYTLKEHDSVRINNEDRVYYRHSTQHGGSVIDFCMEFEGLSQDEAIRRLRGWLSNAAYTTAQNSTARAAPKLHKKVELPKAHKGRYSRVFAYLSKTRSIAPDVISQMIKRKHLYEDEKHNCVFVGFNEKGEAAYGCKRGTNTQSHYRGDCQNSDKRCGWYVDNHADRLIVTEAPIDAMSFMTMLKLYGRQPEKYNYLALGGVADCALQHLFENGKNAQITRVYLATDNDKAGNEARAALRKALTQCAYKGKIIDKVPLHKDWNDDLKALMASRQPPKNVTQSDKPKNKQRKERGITIEQGA